MNPVVLLVMPDNGRLEFDPEGSEAILGTFATLPIPMPRSASAWTGPDGKPIALWCDNQRIRPADFAVVLTGIEQYNNDLVGRGTEPALPAAVMEAVVREEEEDWDDE